MLRNEQSGETYNPQIAAASNYIGQKLFAYISHGQFINDRIKNKFSKSLIFIGDEGQIFQPLTNTYIGIGQTAYTNAITYIEEAHEKIDALNKMLTASMVTAVYANWGKDTWQLMGDISDEIVEQKAYPNISPGKFKGIQLQENGEVNEKLVTETFNSLLPTKVYATNDIIIRGIGDYDPLTKLAYTHEVAHVTDANNDGLDNDPLTLAQKAVLEGSMIKNASKKAFATSGITVELEKGLNRYMFTYTFKTPTCIPGSSISIWTEEDAKTCKKTPSWTRAVTVYFTKDDFDALLTSDTYKFTDYEDLPILKRSGADITRVDASNGVTEDIDDTLTPFIDGLMPVYEDGFALITFADENRKTKYKYITDKEINDDSTIVDNLEKYFSGDYKEGKPNISNTWIDFWKERYYLKHQLFKQGKNTISIDDKLTWSYMASAYSYALDFSRDYTDSQVERIYRDLLGETAPTLIPVSFDQVAIQVVKEDAERTINNVNVVWDAEKGKWITSIVNRNDLEGDDMPDSSKKLRDYKLNEGSIYVRGVKYSKPTTGSVLQSLRINSNVSILSPENKDTVLPWFLLVKLSKFVEKFIKDYNKSLAFNPRIYELINGKKYFKPISDMPDYNLEVVKYDLENDLSAPLFEYFEDEYETSTDEETNTVTTTLISSKYTKLINYALEHSPKYEWTYQDKFNKALEGLEDPEDLYRIQFEDSFKYSEWINNGNTLNNLFFMNYEKDTNYKDVMAGTLASHTESFLDADELSSYPDGNYDREGDSKPFESSKLEGNEGKDKTAEEINAENDLSKYDGDAAAEVPPSNPEGGKFGLPAGNEWGEENTEHGYYGTEYSLNKVFKIIDDLYDDVVRVVNDLGTVLDTEDFADKTTIDLYVVNTGWTPESDINLADGIQTLKEVAYVLDIITDGWGNHYEDGEGNGLLLTYTIANNHDRIVDHERRLKKIESGENVVKGIGRLDFLTSKFVDITLTSDILWQFKYMLNEDNFTENELYQNVNKKVIEDNNENSNYADKFDDFKTSWDLTQPSKFGLDETAEWLGFWDAANTGAWLEDPDTYTTYFKKYVAPSEGSLVDQNTYNIKISRISTSYIVAYNTYMKHYLKDKAYRTYSGEDGEETSYKPEKVVGIPNPRPTWSDIIPGLVGVGILECNSETYREKHKPGKESTYIFKTPDSRYLAIHSYVGHVGLGIDLKLAQTYTTTKNIHDGYKNSTGFVCTDLNSPILKKKVQVYAYLPILVSTNDEIDYFGTEFVKENINNFNKRYTFIFDKDGETAEYAKKDNYANEEERLSWYNTATPYDKFNELNKGLMIFDESYDYGLLRHKLIEMGIFDNVSDDIDETEFNDKVVDIKFYPITDPELINSDKAYFKFDYIIDANDAVVNYATNVYTGKLYANNIEPLYPINSDSYDIDTNARLYQVSSTASPELFLRYIAKEDVTTVDLEYDGLTTTKWVTTYVNNVVDNMSNELKKLEFESYRFAENLIKGLDNNYEAERGKMVVGISQKNGIVTPILRDLPKDDFTASYVIWGENTEFNRNYVKLSSEDIANEILTGENILEISVNDEAGGTNEVTYTLSKDYPLYVPEKDAVDYILLDSEDYKSMGLNPGNDVSELMLLENAINKLSEKYEIMSDHLFVKIGDKYIDVIDTHKITTNQIRSSWRVGLKYEFYVPVYFVVQHYSRIDGAQIEKSGNEFKINYKDVDYFAKPNREDSTIFIVANPESTKESRQYISTEVVQRTAYDGGEGGNSMNVTVHITKLADASENNSGLVDAYDVRETLNNMFEWVDLSRFDLDEDANDLTDGTINVINPINTMAFEEGGYRDATFNTDTANTLGEPIYPVNGHSDQELVNKKIELSDAMNAWYKDNNITLTPEPETK